MFVVFEGIDGSGKNTVSTLVGEALRKRGFDVDHIREGGTYASELVSRLRDFGKDPRNMAMRPLSEFLMYMARDAQLLEECTKPALEKGGLVFADRYFYSYEVLGHYGRGLEVEQVRPIIESVAQGIWPDLVVLMDVDPHLARVRRRVNTIQRIAEGGQCRQKSRKGLGGAGMQHRLRDGYLKLAEREPNRWLVIDNTHTDLELVVDRVAEAVASLYEGASSARVVASTSVSTRMATSAEAPKLEAAREAFYEMVALRREKEPPVAAYFLSGLQDDEAESWREELVEEAPVAVAYGLRGLDTDHSWSLRERLEERAPHFVALSLQDIQGQEARADVHRQRLVERVPQAVLETLGRDDRDFAWKLRDEWFHREPCAVVASLHGMDGNDSWLWRDRFVEAMGGNDGLIREQPAMHALLASICGISSDRAWEIRDRASAVAPVEVLESLMGLTCGRSWQWREEYASLAPRIILRTFDGQSGDRAWAMRQRFASRTKEALDSMRGLDETRAWGMREALKTVWPSTVVNSLGGLAYVERGLLLIEELLDRYPDNLSLLKHATRVAGVERGTGAQLTGVG